MRRLVRLVLFAFALLCLSSLTGHPVPVSAGAVASMAHHVSHRAVADPNPSASPTAAPVSSSVGGTSVVSPTALPGSGNADASGKFPPDTVVSASGQTHLLVRPVLLRTGQKITVQSVSRPYALIVVKLTYPDGETTTVSGRSNRDGYLKLMVQVQYTPADRFAIATLTLTAALPSAGFYDTVSENVNIIAPPPPKIVWNVRPHFLHVGQPVIVQVRTAPNAQVHIAATFPDGEVLTSNGVSDATGLFHTQIVMNYTMTARRAIVVIVAVVDNGVGGQTQLQQTITLVP